MDNRKHTEGEQAQKRRGRPRWMNKRPRRRIHENAPVPEDDAEASYKKNDPLSDRRSRHQKNNRPEQRSAFTMNNGRLKRREGFASTINMHRELEKTFQEAKKDIQTLKQATAVCALCSETIDEILTAIPHEEEEKGLCHFECVQKELARREELTENESFVYFGSGDFYIVQERHNRGKPYYFFRKRLHYRNQKEARK